MFLYVFIPYYQYMGCAMAEREIFWDKRLGRYVDQSPRAGRISRGHVRVALSDAMRAADAGGSALAMLLALLGQGITRDRAVPIDGDTVTARWGLSPRQVADAVARLEQTGLIATVRNPGKRIWARMGDQSASISACRGPRSDDQGSGNSEVAGHD